MSIMEQKMQELMEGSDYALNQMYEEIVDTSINFAEWIDIEGIRDGRHEWKYKGDNYRKKYTTREMYDLWLKELELITNKSDNNENS